jgi:WD repeat-containing protein 48
MTLATLRAHVWKGGPDVQLFYKSNGKREIPFQKKNEEVVEERVGEATSGANEQGAANAQGT